MKTIQILLILVFIMAGSSQQQNLTDVFSSREPQGTQGSVEVEPDAVKHPEEHQTQTRQDTENNNEEKTEQYYNGQPSIEQNIDINKQPQSQRGQETLDQKIILQETEKQPQSQSNVQSVPLAQDKDIEASEARELIIDPNSPSGSLENLTEDQKKKMLQQEAILSALHKDPTGDFNIYANMTTEQLVQMQKKMHQEARKAYENAVKELQQRQKKASEEMDKMMKEQKLTNVQTISHRENKEFRQRKQSFNPRHFEPGRDAYYRHQFHEYMFEVQEKEMQDFSIQMPIAQKVAIYFYTYSNKNGVYSLADDVEDEPAEVQIFENNYQKIVSETFYFKKYITFQGKQHFTYTIKVLNSGISRLFSLNVVHLLESFHISHTVEADVMISHGVRASGISQELEQRIDQRSKRKIMQVSNESRLMTGIKHYEYYKIIEIFFILGACLIQIKMIEKLLNSGSIV